MNRPTYKELNNKLTQAKKAVKTGVVNFINPESIASDANELGYRMEDEFINSLTSILDGTSPDNYAGERPPVRSYEKIIMANPLYTFITESIIFNCLVYLKFTLFDNELWVVSFHKNRNLNKGQNK